jgi:hypothetical protein
MGCDAVICSVVEGWAVVFMMILWLVLKQLMVE